MARQSTITLHYPRTVTGEELVAIAAALRVLAPGSDPCVDGATVAVRRAVAWAGYEADCGTCAARIRRYEADALKRAGAA